MHICRECRNTQNRNKKSRSKVNRREEYIRNIHLHAWRSVLRGYLKRKSINKNGSTLDLLGYSSNDLRNHIQCLFSDNMSWDNYGELWHIDHIIPVSLFRDDTPFNIVNSLENLRPLNKTINMSRNNNIDNDCCKLSERYKTYIKEEYIKLIENKINNYGWIDRILWG